MTQVKKTFQLLTSKDVCQIYELLHKDGFVSFGINDESKSNVDTMVASINATYFGVDTYISSEEKSVAYLYYIIKDHPFVDGNKRTAILTFKVLCDLNNLNPSQEIPLDVLAVFIEKTREGNHRDVIKAIKWILFDKKSQIS